MFVSLNKKIIYSILFFFIISSLIFIYTFYIVYGNRIQEELRSNIQRNQQYIDLLYQNINLSNELRNAIRQNKSASITADTKSDAIFGENENSLLKQIHNEQRRIAEFNKNYDERYAAIQESVKILGISSILSILAILLFGYLMTRWILVPLNKISAVSQKVSEGNLNVRIEREHMPKFTDELDYLIITFNQMLDNLQNVISEVKEQEAFLQALIDSIPDGIRVIDENYNIIIANNPFRSYKVPHENVAMKKAVSVETIKTIRDYKSTNKKNRQVTLARDMFMLSFYLAGINMADLFECGPINKDGRLEYNRAKTRDKKKDGAFTSILVIPEALEIIEKYKDPDGIRLLRLYKDFKRKENVQTIVNTGLYRICDESGIPHVCYYTARHSFATIARNDCDVPKDDISLCLTHQSGFKITDTYIKPDFKRIDEVVHKVVSLLY